MSYICSLFKIFIVYVLEAAADFIAYCDLIFRYRGNGEHFPPKNRYWVNQNAQSPMAEYGNGANSFKQQQLNKNGQNKKQPGDSLRKPHWDLDALMPFEKNFYVPHESVAGRSKEEVSSSLNILKLFLN